MIHPSAVNHLSQTSNPNGRQKYKHLLYFKVIDTKYIWAIFRKNAYVFLTKIYHLGISNWLSTVE